MTSPLPGALKTTHIYSNSLWLEPEKGMASVVSEVSAWVEWKTSEPVTEYDLLERSRGYVLGDGSELVVELGDCAEQDSLGRGLPKSVKLTYIHDDRKIPTRQWVTEVKIKRDERDYFSNFKVDLHVVDSAPATKPPILTRPRLMVNVVESCRPVGSTPGLFTRPLTLNSAKKLLSDILSHERKQPIVIVSSNWSMDPPLDVERMRVQLLGMAELYQVTEETDGWALANILGDDYSCYGDAIRFVWPVTRGEDGPKSTILLPNRKGEAPRTALEMERLAVSLVLREGITAL
ncbi:hypothetical protein [Pseudomonas putida]|uniref:Uncharacterized protein n=1 Tax=Pseudomonas putida TaxID=303 RepID=A0A8I1EAG7_PSEPU|nr:hypothetical protein [Pseudomonas putida]MBI6882342.1 hypothetical protein [Pseudomonas putida]